MKLIALFACAVLVTGCSDEDEKAKAMRSFIKSCEVPVSVQLTLSNNFWGGNAVAMTCAKFKEEKVNP